MLRIAICDDDEQDRKELEHCCQRLSTEKIACTYDCYASGELFLQAITAKPDRYDILRLDVEMEGMDGIEIKDRLEAMGQKVRILFITNHDSYSRDAYGEKVYDYLTKPVEYRRLEKDIERILKSMALEERFEILQNPAGFHKVPWKKIKYIKASGKYVYFYLLKAAENERETTVFDERSYSFWSKRMDPEQFIEAKKGLLINLENVKKISRQNESILFEDGSLEKTSVRKTTSVYQALLDYRYQKENRRIL